MAESASVALVTGAARGIGLTIARRMLGSGLRVAMLDIDADALQAAVAQLGDAERVLPLHCDVAESAQVDDAVGRAAAFGRLTCLVNNAGIAVFKPILQTSHAEWRRVLAVNLDGTFLCAQACVPHMQAAGGGSIVNISSISGLRASTLRVAYGTSKAAIAQLTRQQAIEWGELGIRVNAVAPGPVDTAMAKQVHSAEIRAAYHEAIPLNRYGEESEIASAVCFLCSTEASYITGQILAVDGGFEATGIGLPALREH